MPGNVDPGEGIFHVGALSKPSHVRSTMARVIRLAANGKLSTEDMTRYTRSLRQLFDVIEGTEIMRRIEALEAEADRR